MNIEARSTMNTKLNTSSLFSKAFHLRTRARSTMNTKLNTSSLFSIFKKSHEDQSDFNQRHKPEYLVLILESYSLEDRGAIS